MLLCLPRGINRANSQNLFHKILSIHIRVKPHTGHIAMSMVMRAIAPAAAPMVMILGL
jgi:hypothetical protein